MSLALISNKIEIDEPSEVLLQYVKDNLEIANPEYYKLKRMGKWLGKTPPTLYLYEWHGDSLILPYGTKNDVIEMVNTVVDTFPEVMIKIPYNADFKLYEYQKRAVDKLLESDHGILQSPAGSGKTQMALAAITELGYRALWLTHTQDLLTQSYNRAATYIDKGMLGKITGGKVSIGTGITFATVQTMSNLHLPDYEDMWDIVIVDECHRVAGTPTSMTMFSKVISALKAKHKYGVSATVHRSDGLIKATYALLGKVVHTVSEKDISETIVPVGILPINTNEGMSNESLNTDGTINYTKLITDITTRESRNELIVSWLRKSDYSSLILSDRLDHLRELMSMLDDERAVMIDGKMSTKKGKAEREQAIEDMKSGHKKFLFATYALAKEGLDIPRLERLYLTTPQKDFAVVAQSVGRVARKLEGKEDPIVYDFVDMKIPMLVNSYKKRRTTYNKINTYYVELLE